MMRKSMSCLRCSRRSGATLIEVVAGLALMGALLVSMLLARIRYVRQFAESQQRIAAVAAADRMLAAWWSDLAKFPRMSSGRVSGSDLLNWRTMVVRNRDAENLHAQIVRLEIYDASREGGSLLSVDLLLPDKSLDEAEKADQDHNQRPADRAP